MQYGQEPLGRVSPGMIRSQRSNQPTSVRCAKDLAAKQAADVVQFLVSTTGPNDGFRARARSLLSVNPCRVLLSGPRSHVTGHILTTVLSHEDRQVSAGHVWLDLPHARRADDQPEVGSHPVQRLVNPPIDVRAR